MQMKLFSVAFLVYLLIIMFSLGMFTGQGRGQLEWGTTYLIATHADGSASWIIEQRILGLSNVSRYTSKEYLQEFIKNASDLVDNAWLALPISREMEANNFKVTATVSYTSSGSSGTIKHQFDWIGFAKTESERLVIGDVFVEGFFFLGNGSLVLEYPREYHVIKVSPTPDELMEDSQMITWHSIENFDLTQANVVLERETPSTSNFVQEYPAVFFGSIALAGLSSVGLGYILLRNRRKRASSPLSLRIEDEEEKVVALLKAAKGPVYQSTITKQLGFSRSKTSKLLASMESKGIVIRQKKGRDKIVVLRK